MLTLFFSGSNDFVYLPDDIKGEQEAIRLIVSTYPAETIVTVKNELGEVLDTTEIGNIFRYPNK
jgi:hypothetical protein